MSNWVKLGVWIHKTFLVTIIFTLLSLQLQEAKLFATDDTTATPPPECPMDGQTTSTDSFYDPSGVNLCFHVNDSDLDESDEKDYGTNNNQQGLWLNFFLMSIMLESALIFINSLQHAGIASSVLLFITGIVYVVGANVSAWQFNEKMAEYAEDLESTPVPTPTSGWSGDVFSSCGGSTGSTAFSCNTKDTLITVFENAAENLKDAKKLMEQLNNFNIAAIALFSAAMAVALVELGIIIASLGTATPAYTAVGVGQPARGAKLAAKARKWGAKLAKLGSKGKIAFKGTKKQIAKNVAKKSALSALGSSGAVAIIMSFVGYGMDDYLGEAFFGDSEEDLNDGQIVGLMVAVIAIEMALSTLYGVTAAYPAGRAAIAGVGITIATTYMETVVKPAISRISNRLGWYEDRIANLKEIQQITPEAKNNEEEENVREDHVDRLDEQGTKKPSLKSNSSFPSCSCSAAGKDPNVASSIVQGPEACEMVQQGKCNTFSFTPPDSFKNSEFTSATNNLIKDLTRASLGGQGMDSGMVAAAMDLHHRAMDLRKNVLADINKALLAKGDTPLDMRNSAQNLLKDWRAAAMKELNNYPELKGIDFSSSPLSIGAFGPAETTEEKNSKGKAGGAGGNGDLNNQMGKDDKKAADGYKNPFESLNKLSADKAEFGSGTGGGPDLNKEDELGKFKLDTDSVVKNSEEPIWPMISRRYILSLDRLFKVKDMEEAPIEK